MPYTLLALLAPFRQPEPRSRFRGPNGTGGGDLSEACWATPALSRGSLFPRTREALHRFDGR